MNINKLLVIPLAFIAGILLIVLLQAVGLVQIDTQFGTNKRLAVASITTSAEDNNVSGFSGDAAQSVVPTTAANSAVDTQSAPAQGTATTLTQQLDELRKQVQAATVDRDVLRQEIKQLDELVVSATAGDAFLPDGEGDSQALASANANSNQVSPFGRRRFGPPDGDEQYASLVAAGIDPTVAGEIKQRTDQWSLQRLELIDQAAREGWQGSDQFQDRLTELQEERPDVRSELGDTDYDRFLYESGDANRVQVASIIDGSAAQLAGVESGDLVRSYADNRIFNTRELQTATREGARGETVFITVERGGQEVVLELPRGPLGVSLTGLNVEPGGF